MIQLDEKNTCIVKCTLFKYRICAVQISNFNLHFIYSTLAHSRFSVLQVVQQQNFIGIFLSVLLGSAKTHYLQYFQNKI